MSFAASPLDPTKPAGRPAIKKVLESYSEYQRQKQDAPSGLSECLVVSGRDGADAGAVFQRLRWGGVAAYVSESGRETRQAAARFAASGFAIETGPTYVREGRTWLPLPLLTRKTHYFIARKVLLLPPGAVTERFTYQVELERRNDPSDPLIVRKEVPSFDSMVARLHQRFPDVAMDIIERRAKKFTDRIFPTFLTREAAILMILQDHLPASYQQRVPRLLGMEQDEDGLVHKLRMTWLRNGGKPLPQVEFARQSADLLRVIHDVARVIHLDLRLDNFVITPNGVGFVDFGSAVRDDENIHQNPMVGSLFEELMRTSQIQRMLNQMMVSGHVTSDVIRRSHQKAEKAVDFFYLAVQFNSPHMNPDLADLIQYDPISNEARNLARLTTEVLRPNDPANPKFRSAKDILHGIERMQLKLQQTW